MKIVNSASSEPQFRSRATRLWFFLFGAAAHVLFLVVFAALACFVGGFLLPRTIDGPATGAPTWIAVIVNVSLLALFGAQHSVMARPGFKRRWTRIVPPPIERSMYVMISNVLVVAIIVFWLPIDIIVWDMHHPAARIAMWALFALGWVGVPVVSLMINHFDLFGTRQVWLHLRRRGYEDLPFRTPMLYRFVRHPLYVGWMIAFWAAPTMTLGHAIFAAVLTLYMLIAIPLEERDLVNHFGEHYIQYRARVGALIPRAPRRNPAALGPELEPAAGMN